MAEDGQSKGNGAWIKDIILEFANSPENNLGPGMDERAFDDPLIGFARGDDPIFDEFKRHIGEFSGAPPGYSKRPSRRARQCPESLPL